MALTIIEDQILLSIPAEKVSGGPETSTTIISNPLSGLQQRNVNRLDALHRFSINWSYLSQAELRDLKTFFLCRNGRGRGFRFKDFTDYWASPDGTPEEPESSINVFAEGDGTTTIFGLYKKYTDDIGTEYLRRIIKPVHGFDGRGDTIKIYLNGVLQGSGYVLTEETGVLDFQGTPPGNGVEIGWKGQFDVPVMFDLDFFNPQIGDAITEISYSGLPLVEIPAAAYGLEV